MNARWKSLLAVALGAAAPAAAHAEVETWLGVSGEVTAGYVDPGEADEVVSGSQIEGGFLLTSGPLTVDLQIDFFFDNANGVVIENPPADGGPARFVRPETAKVQLDLDGPIIRAGVVNTGFGLEDWDLWNNRLPTYSNYYTALSPGRLLGGELAYDIGDGNEVSVHGGYDLDWESLRVGAAIGYEAESWSTWSGVAVYPEVELYELIFGGEVTAVQALTIAYDGSAGAIEGSAFLVADLTFVAFPDGMIAPALRLEGTVDPDGATGAPDFTAGLGATAWPFEFLRVAAEVKGSYVGDRFVPGVFGAVSVHSPFPPEDEEQEGGDGDGAAEGAEAAEAAE